MCARDEMRALSVILPSGSTSPVSMNLPRNVGIIKGFTVAASLDLEIRGAGGAGPVYAGPATHLVSGVFHPIGGQAPGTKRLTFTPSSGPNADTAVTVYFQEAPCPSPKA